jgi:hypothetical protein
MATPHMAAMTAIGSDIELGLHRLRIVSDDTPATRRIIAGGHSFRLLDLPQSARHLPGVLHVAPTPIDSIMRKL